MYLFHQKHFLISVQECSLRDEKNKKAATKRWFFKQIRFCVRMKRCCKSALKNLHKTAPALIPNLKGELNDVLQQRIHQVITGGGTQLKEVGPQLLKGAIEDAYKMPFRLLENFGNKKLTEAKKQLNRELDKLKNHIKI